MSSRPRLVVGTFAATAAAALALSGCGGLATQSQVPLSEDCGESVLIGAPLPLSGPFTDFGTNSLQGMQIAVDEINAAGGIAALGGTQLEIQTGDTSTGDPAQASSATTKLIEDGSVALIGAWSSALTNSVSTVAEEGRIPILTQSWADTLSERGYEYYFQPPPKSSQIGAAATSYLIDAAESVGVSFDKVAGVGPNDVANTAQITAAVDAFKAAGVAADEPTFYQLGLTDVTPIVTRIVEQAPDIILLSGSPADASLIVSGLRARGIETPILGFGGAFVVPSFADLLGDDVEGLLAVGAWNADLPFDGVPEAAAAYQEAHGQFMPMEAGESWVDVYLIAAAMEETASCDPEDIAGALREIDVTSGPAAAMPGGEVSFDEDGTNPHAVPVLTQWVDGVPATVWPEEYAAVEVDLGQE
ncbi:MAG TPA: ABC transporter substrate-binding protein [Pseudolysinimonas sp.]|nr:ABC transporter substrate-binding protein [Pseudolysinimonas sp.]